MNPLDSKDIGLTAELRRKAIHLFALVIPAGIWLVPLAVAQIVLLACFSIALAMDLIRTRPGAAGDLIRRILRGVLRPHEQNRFTGGTYILAAGSLCSFLFEIPVAVAAMIFIILGDTAAVFVGRYLGRIHIGHKTLEGSIGFFVAALAGVLWIPQLPLHVKVTGALVAAAAEVIPQPIDDNLVVPIISGIVISAILY
jgi:dolichol kinase